MAADHGLLNPLPERPAPPLKVAVSACLLGVNVRHDGGHKRSSLCHERLQGLFELVGYCPEVAIGMGVPRDPIRLVGDAAAPRVRGVKNPDLDVTDALAAYAREVSARLDDVAGYIFIKGSPSCGLFRVRVHPESGRGAPSLRGRGIFAAEIVRCLPNLPVEESGRLEDDVLRENFVTRVFAYAHWRRVTAEGLTPARLIAFHSRYKYLLMAHSVTRYREAGRLLADLTGDLPAIAERYASVLMSGLAQTARRGGHANVLQHLQGHLKERIDASSRRELAELIHAYRRDEAPLMAPLTLLKHHLARHGDEYLALQVYLEPHPPAAGLRRAL